MSQPYRTIYFKVVIEKKTPPVTLSLDQIRNIPCHEIYFKELEEKFFEIRFKPQNGVTDEMVLYEHLKALRQRYKIRQHEVYDIQNDWLIGGK